MKFVRQLIFVFVVVTGLSVAASAQKNDRGKKPPPKERPPVVTPERDKKPPRDNRGGDRDKSKKPEMSWLFASKKSTVEEA